MELLDLQNIDNLNFLLDAIEEAGYVVSADLRAALQYYSAAGRKRAFGLCLNYAKAKMTKAEGQRWVKKVCEIVTSLAKIDRVCHPGDVLRPDGHWRSRL